MKPAIDTGSRTFTAVI